MEQKAENENKVKIVSRKRWFWITGVFVLIIAGLLVGGLGLFGLLPWQSGELYKDPQGRFTMKVGPRLGTGRDGWALHGVCGGRPAHESVSAGAQGRNDQ